MKYSKRKNYQSGQAMLVAVFFFLSVSTVIVVGIIVPIIRQVQISKDLVESKKGFYLATATTEDAVYRLKSGASVVTGESLTLDGRTAMLQITTTPSGKTVLATADQGGLIRKVQASVSEGVGAAFNYGVQAGTGGFQLGGGSTVNGNVYANASITSTSGSTITGSAIAANAFSLTTDQANNTPVPISSCTSSTCVTFGNSTATQDLAQSFQLTESSPINYFRFYIKKVGNPADATVRVVTNNNGSPSTTNLLTTNGTLSASQVSTNFGWINVVLPSNPTLSTNTTYWVVIDSASNSSNYYVIGANSAYTNGMAKIGRYSNTWNNTTPTGLDSYFEIYLGGITSVVGGGSYVGAINVGTNGVGDAWARTVKGANVAGTIYCQSGSNNNKACNTSRPDPAPAGFPISEANIEDWKNDTTSISGGWTYGGDLTIGYQGTTTSSLKHIAGNLNIGGGGTADFGELQVDGNVIISGGGRLKAGPMKINGNLTVGSTGMTVKGTIYVVGNIIISGGGAIGLSPSYGTNSGVIITDGRIDLSGGGSFSGSGQGGSYPMLVTTSTCPNGSGCDNKNAIEFSGGAGAVILNAQEGTINMSGGSAARSLAAQKIIVGGGGTITYDIGLANLNFSSGPSGGWEINSWKEVE